MNRLVRVLILAGALAATGNLKAVGQTYVIHGPTIVAFFPPVTRSDLDNNPDTNEALSDFQFYAASVRTPLRNARIDFEEADASSFEIRIGAKVRTFRTGKVGIGYYFIAPGRKPHIEYGVMTDQDILDVARKYFNVAIP